jgi:hypothetical protein
MTAWAMTAAVVPIPVPATTPPIPNGPYSASAATAETTRSISASAVARQGRWMLKKVRVCSR